MCVPFFSDEFHFLLLLLRFPWGLGDLKGVKVLARRVGFVEVAGDRSPYKAVSRAKMLVEEGLELLPEEEAFNGRGTYALYFLGLLT